MGLGAERSADAGRRVQYGQRVFTDAGRKGIWALANVKPDKYGEVIRSVGYEIGIFSIVPPYSETTLVSSMWSIGHTSEQPDKAMRVLNEMYTNPELANLLTYGIEGKPIKYWTMSKILSDFQRD